MNKGDRPTVAFLYPEDAKTLGKDIREYGAFAHLAGHQSLDYLKYDKPFIIDAIIVNGGAVCYNTYFLYFERARPLYDVTGAPMPNFPEEYKNWK